MSPKKRKVDNSRNSISRFLTKVPHVENVQTVQNVQKFHCKLQGQIALCDMALSGQRKWYNNGLRMQENSL